MRPPRILVVNTHSVLNSGDAAIVLAQIGLIRRAAPEARLAVTSRTPRLDGLVYRPLGVEVLPAPFPVPSLWPGAPRQSGVFGWGLARLAAALRRTDLVIASGGGYFYSHRPAFPGPMFFQNYLPLRLALRAGKTVIFFPMSFGPMFNGTAGELLRRLLASPGVKRIFAREPVSEAFLKKLLPDEAGARKIAPAPDAAFGFEPAGSEDEGRELAISARRPLVAFTLRPWAFPSAKDRRERDELRESYLESMAEAGRHVLVRRKGSLLVFPQSRGPGSSEDDRPISRRWQSRLAGGRPSGEVRYEDLPPGAHPGRISRLLASADASIATRFHAAILGFPLGLPAVAIAYQPKSAGMMETLGLGRFCLEISGLSAPDLAGRLDEILDAGERLRGEIRATAAGARERLSAVLVPALTAALAEVRR